MIDIDAELAAMTPEPILWRGRTWQPRLGIPRSLIVEIGKLDEEGASSFDYLVAVLAALLQVDADEIRELDPTEIELERVAAHARGTATVGELSASPDSSESGEAPSQPTSDGSTT